MARKREVLPPTTMWPPYLAKQTLLLISVLSVLFYWLSLSLDSIKMMCGCSSQVAMLNVSAAILDNSFKTSTPFIDTVINETLWEFVPLGDYRSLHFFHRLELSLVVDSLLKSTPNSVGLIHGIISGLFGGHMWGSLKLMCFFSDSPSWSGRSMCAGAPSCCMQCPFVMTTYCSDVRQQTLFEDDIAVA